MHIRGENEMNNQWLFCFLSLIVPLKGRTTTTNHYKFILTDQVFPMKKHFYPDGSCLFQDDNAHIHREQGFTEYKNNGNYMLWLL